MLYKWEVEKWAREITGELVDYNGRYFTVNRVEIKEKLVKLHTNSLDVVILNEDWAEAKQEVKVIETKKQEPMKNEIEKKPDHNEIRQNKLPDMVIKRSGEALADILLKNIEKVGNDPAYIPQAKEINSNVKAIIELAKTEIQYYKVLVDH